MKYDIVYADPPWSYNKKVGQGVADEQYDTMPLEEIKKFPIGEMVNDDAVLFIWVTYPMLREAFEVIDAWGFIYKTCAFTWIKTNSDGSPFFGIGHYTKSNAELCLLCVRGGGIPVVDNTVSQVILSRKDKHSKKPYEAYVRIEKLYGEVSRIELFSRHNRGGWANWGNETPDSKQLTLETSDNSRNPNVSEGGK